MAGHHSNMSILNMAWNSSDGTADNNLLSGLTESKQPPSTEEPRMRIQVTAPPGESKQASQLPPSGPPSSQSQPPQQPSQQPPQQPPQQQHPAAPEPPTLAESAAFWDLKMYHEMGLDVDSEYIFDAQSQPKHALNLDTIYNNNMNEKNGVLNGNNINNTNGSNENKDNNNNNKPMYNANESRLNNLAMNGILAAVKEDGVLTPTPGSPQPPNANNNINNEQKQEPLPNNLTRLNGVNGIMTYSNVLDGDNGNGLFDPLQMNAAMMNNGQIPKPLRGGMYTHNLMQSTFEPVQICIYYI